MAPKLISSIECTRASGKVRFSPDGAILVVQDGGDGLTILDTNDGQVKANLKNVARASMDFVFTSDGQHVILANDAKVQSLDLKTGGATVLYRHTGGIVQLAYSPKRQIVASSSLSKSVKLWDISSAKEITTIQGDDLIEGLVFLPDGKTLVGAGGSSAVPSFGRVWIWDVPRTGEPRTLEGYKHAIKVIAISPDGKTLATQGESWDVWLWDIQQGTIKAKLKPAKFRGVAAITFSSDGRTLVVGGGNGNPPGIRISPGMVSFWDTKTGKEIHSFAALDDMVRSIALSSDGTRMAVSNDQSLKIVKIWDVSSITQRAP
jgi:WD40 repeat protein